MEKKYNRAAEDIGNAVGIGHVNVRIDDQHKATHFYITGLGYTRDPFLNTGAGNMWINVGMSQFHLPMGKPDVVRGTTGLVMPDRRALLERLNKVKKALDGTKFQFRESNDGVETVCPWGNRITVHEPDVERFGRVQLGMPYVRFDVRPGAADGAIGGYSVLRADDMDSAVALVRDHPFVTRGGSLTVHEGVAP